LLPGHFLDSGVDASGVLAARTVLVLQERLHVLEHGTIEGLALREARQLRSDLCRSSSLMSLLPLSSKLSMVGASLTHHDQRAAITAQLDITEEAGVVQRPHRLAHALRREVVADVDR
jgi:hypothetical protein